MHDAMMQRPNRCKMMKLGLYLLTVVNNYEFIIDDNVNHIHFDTQGYCHTTDALPRSMCAMHPSVAVA